MSGETDPDSGNEKEEEILLKNVYDMHFERLPSPSQLEHCFEQNAEREQREQTVDGMRLIFDIPKEFPEFKVEIEYFDADEAWFSNFYKQQENIIWRKSRSRKQWYCLVCRDVFTSFSSLKAHINRHMGFLRYKCNGCEKRYGCENCLKYHKKKHEMERSGNRSDKLEHVKKKSSNHRKKKVE